MGKRAGEERDQDNVAVLYLENEGLIGQQNIISDVQYVIACGFDDIYVLTAQPKGTESELRKTFTADKLKNKKLHVIQEEAHSVADVFRTLDNMSVISTDFVFFHGPRRVTEPLMPYLEKHKATVKKDKNAIITLVYTYCTLGHPEKTSDLEQVLVVDSTRKIHACVDGSARLLQIPAEASENNASVRFDLVTSGVYICTPKIPALFTENFDFHDIRDLVKHALMEDEVATSNVYLEEVQGVISLGDLRNHFESSEDLFLPPKTRVQEHPEHHYDSESNTESEDGDYDEERERTKELDAFFREVFESLERGFHDKLKPNDLILEINGSRYAYNVPVNVIGGFVIKAILTLNTQLVGSKDGGAQFEHLTRMLKGLSAVLKNYVSESKEEEQESFLKQIEEYCNTEPIVIKYTQRLLHGLYEEEILASECIVQWHPTLTNTTLKSAIGKFVEWLQEEDDSDESEEDSEESD